FDTLPGAANLERTLHELCERAEAAARDGAQILVLSDRAIAPWRAPIPGLLALGAVHQRLIETGLRAGVGIVVRAGDAWDGHHLAALIGSGAGAVCPWLALRPARALGEDEPRRAPANGQNGQNGHQRTSLHAQASEYPDADSAEHNYLKAADKGLLKIM